LSFRLSPDGRTYDLLALRRIPPEALYRGAVRPEWDSERLKARAKEVFEETHVALATDNRNAARQFASERFLETSPEFLRIRAARSFEELGRAPPIDDVRIFEMYDCPDGGPEDHLRVFFGLWLPVGEQSAESALREGELNYSDYRFELWRFRPSPGGWLADEIELINPDIIARNYAETRGYPDYIHCARKSSF
jgi:hypothetical protein